MRTDNSSPYDAKAELDRMMLHLEVQLPATRLALVAEGLKRRARYAGLLAEEERPDRRQS